MTIGSSDGMETAMTTMSPTETAPMRAHARVTHVTGDFTVENREKSRSAIAAPIARPKACVSVP